MQSLRFYGVGDIRLERIAAPAITAAGQVRLRVIAAGICGSDLHNYCSGQWIAQLPVTPGHEVCAEVIETAADVAGFALGDMVVADSRVFCGRCRYCLAGRQNLCTSLGFVGEVCDGGFAEQMILAATGLIRLPRGADPLMAAMSEPLAVALHAIKRLNPARGMPIVITGGGPIGGLVALTLAKDGFGPLAVAERNPHRAALLAALAGAAIIELSAPAIAEFCGNAGLHFAVEATGSAAAASILFDSIAPGGRLALVGLFHGPATLDLNRAVEREIELFGCSVFRDELTEAVAMLPAFGETLRCIAATPIGLADVADAYAKLLRGETTTLKTLIQP